MKAPDNSYQVFDAYFAATRHKLYAFILKHTRDAHLTQDILQICYIKLWQDIDKVDPARVEGLLITIAANTLIDHHRKQTRSIVKLQEHLPESISIEDTPLAAVEYKELRDITNDHINKLSPKRKKIFRLVREFGLSHKEVSEIMGLSTKTVKKQINKSLRILRSLHQML